MTSKGNDTFMIISQPLETTKKTAFGHYRLFKKSRVLDRGEKLQESGDHDCDNGIMVSPIVF